MSASEEPRVLVEWHDRVAHVLLSRPRRRNAMDAAMWTTLRETALQLAAERPRAVVLTGAGDHFCSGMDLTMANPLVQRLAPAVLGKDTSALTVLVEELKSTMQAVADLPCPVIAAVEGSCLGAGLELALCADIRVASETAVFAMPETRFGMVPDVGGTVRLSRLVGAGRASHLILTGAQLRANRAEAWGLVTECVPAGDALATGLKLAGAASKMSPTANREALGILRAHPGDDGRFQMETAAGVRALLSGEVMEGLASFTEKRDARW